MDIQLLLLLVGTVSALIMGFYFYLEQQARTLKTRIVNLRDGLRFEAHGFSLEVQRTPKRVKVQANAGVWTSTPLEGGEAVSTAGSHEELLPAAGLKLEVARMPKTPGNTSAASPSGMCTITVTGSDALTNASQNIAGGKSTVVKIDKVPDQVALSFQQFAGRVRVWVEKVERRVEMDRKDRLRKESEAAEVAEQERLFAEASAGKAPDQPLTDADRQAIGDAQIATWRAKAGFTGTSSEVLLGPDGRVLWFLDLHNDGRITLHADKRTIHASLVGATVASLGGEVEIGVRDDYWTEEDPALRTFKVLKGLPAEQRRAWKERLDIVRNSVNKDPARS
jgi:hypothetical protein